jgi:hypothetical protein
VDHDYNYGGATAVGTRAVVVRGGHGRSTERRTVVDESHWTVTVDDGTRFSKADGVQWGDSAGGSTDLEDAHCPTHIVTEGNPDFDELWADAVLSAYTGHDQLAYVEDSIAANLLTGDADVHAHYDVSGIIDELTPIGQDYDEIPQEQFWAVVARHRLAADDPRGR